MEINSKYQLTDFPLNLEVVRALDFELDPILLLEKDRIGNKFLSYLININSDKERRVYLQVSEERLNEILAGNFSLFKAFSIPENNYCFFADYSLESGALLESYLVPVSEFSRYNLVPEDYIIPEQYSKKEVKFESSELLAFSERKQKIVLDFYLQGQNLINNIKPYAFYKVFTPIVEIIKNMLEFDSRNADRFLAFSNPRQSSLGITIEINYSNDLFLEKETEVLENIIFLLNSQNKEDFNEIISRTKNENYLKHYITIIKAIIDNNADLHTAYANPVNKDIRISKLDKEKAILAKNIIDEEFDVIEDVEEINGTFLEIDIDRKEPSFKIYSNEEEITIRGKFETSIIEKVKSDFINIGKENYKFTIKTLYFPETTFKPEEIKRYLIDYTEL